MLLPFRLRHYRRFLRRRCHVSYYAAIIDIAATPYYGPLLIRRLPLSRYADYATTIIMLLRLLPAA